MPSFLISVGADAQRHLPDVFTFLSCGAAVPAEDLRVLSILPDQSDPIPGLQETVSLCDALSGCRGVFASSRRDLFLSGISFASCTPVLPSVRSFASQPDAAALLAALRGPGMPLSLRTDREAVEWCFSALLSRPEDESLAPFRGWLRALESGVPSGQEARLFLMADLADPFSGGVTMVLLQELRSLLRNLSVSVVLLALGSSASPVPDSFGRSYASVLQELSSRSLLRESPDSPSRGADAFYFLSLPSSFMESPEADRILALPAARILGQLSAAEEAVVPGLHIPETEGTFSLVSLGGEAVPFAAFLRLSVWGLTDLFPSLRHHLAHPARLRSLALNPKAAVFRQLFSASAEETLRGLDVLEPAFRSMLSVLLRFLRSLPSSLRLLPENAVLWQKASDACGRVVTVAAELEVTRAEARESGLDSVRPVHRDSLADTEEEQLLRKLQEMEAQLDYEKKLRSDSLAALGGFRSAQVRLDCLRRCRSALTDAEKKLAETPDEADHLLLLKRRRRVRLLRSAVSFCRSELEPAPVCAGLSALPSGRDPAADPFAGSLLSPEACRALESFLASPAGEAVPSIPRLFADLNDPDPKVFWKSLQASCTGSGEVSSLTDLLEAARRLFADDLSSAQILSPGAMPPLPFLPDLLPDPAPRSLKEALTLFPGAPSAGSDLPETRGLLAMLFLRLYRRRSAEEAALSVSVLSAPSGGDAPLIRYWLAAHQSQKVVILSLTRGEQSCPFALVLPGRALLPARRTGACADLVPAFVPWFDRENNVFSDPCPGLGEGDRLLLQERLDACLARLPVPPSGEDPFRAFLRAFRADLAFPEAAAADPAFPTRLRAVCGLLSVPEYAPLLTKVSCFYEHFLPQDSVASCLTGEEDFPASACAEIPEEVLYLWRGVPFAREDSRLLLDSPHASGEDVALSRLSAECAVLEDSSDDFRDALLAGIPALLARHPETLPAVRAAASSLQEEASRPLDRREPVFTWPWDAKSPSLRAVIRECLGDSLADAALLPFADRAAVLPARGGDVIGDSLFSSMCTVVPRALAAAADPASVAPDAVLPPLSPAFAQALCSCPEGRTLLRPGLLSFEYTGQDALRVSLLLDGTFPLRLVRTYAADEIIQLYSHDLPTVAVWPSIPLAPDAWKAYYLYAHLPHSFSLQALPEGGSFSPLQSVADTRAVGTFSGFPVCVALFREDQSLGVLPNVLPRPVPESSAPVTVCLDFGSAGTSVVFASSGGRRPLQGPVMVRTLLNNPSASRDLLRREFLPAVPVSALLPTVTRLFRNVPGASPVPFADGIILMSADLQDLLSTPSEAVYSSLKWEAEKGRSGFLCLHQIMLMAALQARCEGASGLSWRFALPDEMAKEGRESLLNLFAALASEVHAESGYPLPDSGIPVSFAPESSALGAYFRFCAPEETRGGFMVLDLGACAADISLFLRGREQAVRACQLPLGVQYMFLPSLLRDPELLSRELGFCPEEPFRSSLSLLVRLLQAARTDPAALRRARVALDFFIGDELPLLVRLLLQQASSGVPTRLGALLLLHLSYLMMLSGLVLLQLASDPSKNDFLPGQMTLCLSGRGAALFEALPVQLQSSLWHFIAMFRNRRIASVSLLFSAEKKMEIPVGLSLLQEVWSGLPPASSVPVSTAVRPADLLPEFLRRFRQEFPFSAELLFPGFFTADLFHPFSPRGEAFLAESVRQTFPHSLSESPRPYDALASWPQNLLDLLANA